MTRDQLQQRLIDGIDKILSAPVLSWRLSDEDKRLLQCQRQLWAAGGLSLDELLALVNAAGG